MKKCFKCGEVKPLNEFYKHSMMADGHLNKCKCCAKKDVRVNRKDNIDYYREYDRERGSRRTLEDLQRYRDKFPNKYAAHTAVNNAKRAGEIVEQSCEKCGGTDHIHAHHDDYNKPLEVRWLCAVHHKEWHDLNGEALNG